MATAAAKPQPTSNDLARTASIERVEAAKRKAAFRAVEEHVSVDPRAWPDELVSKAPLHGVVKAPMSSRAPLGHPSSVGSIN